MDRVREQLKIKKLAGLEKNPVVVAVLDSGIDGKHPDFKGKICAFQDFVYHKTVPYDDYGHGTHVCGCIAGTGAASSGRYSGIADNARILMGKVLDENGDGTIENMLQGIYWVIEHQEKYRIRILNISVGTGKSYDAPEFREIMKALNLAWYRGILVICAAGNGGPKKNTISYIGLNQNILTIGCHDDGVNSRGVGRPCETYSGRGEVDMLPRKPDLVAPGTGIISCAVSHPEAKVYYGMKSGTSMATAIVSGCASLYFGRHFDESNEYCKRQMIYTARDLGDPWNKQGYGMINPTAFV